MSKLDTVAASVASLFNETKSTAKGIFCSLVLLMACISQPAVGAAAPVAEGAEGAGAGAGAGGTGVGGAGVAAAGGIGIGTAVAIGVVGAALVGVAIDNANDSSTPADTPDTPSTTATTGTTSTTATTATTATSGTQ